mmetsp:Transcript_23478/g.41284  ORF Transcript_23478/g.41284 Transcript_23478/m.41284 type:complete len:443 (-) Transcript_23478:4-1332(-)
MSCQDPVEARLYRREFHVMCIAFSLNHAAVTTPIIYASSVLTEEIGNASNAVLYGVCLLSSLFISNLFYAVLGPKRGLLTSMVLYALYLGLFAAAVSQCARWDSHDKCVSAKALQAPVVYLGAVFGGMGAGLLWTCQGAFYALVCERLAAAESKPSAEVTGELAGIFGVVFLGFECAVRASTTLMRGPQYLNLSYMTTFCIWTGAACASFVGFALFATNLQPSSQAKKGSNCDKLLAAVRLWSDPKLWLLQCTNITFAFGAAWLAGYVSPRITSKALSSSFLGFATAILSGLAALLSRVLAPVAGKIGKGPVLALGSLAFLCLGITSKWTKNPVEWGWGVFIFYVFMGIGRAVYETTNKAIVADVFPLEKSPSAFANVFVFGTGGSTAAYIFGALKVTTPELYLLIVFAGLTVPCFMAASALKAADARSIANGDGYTELGIE